MLHTPTWISGIYTRGFSRANRESSQSTKDGAPSKQEASVAMLVILLCLLTTLSLIRYAIASNGIHLQLTSTTQRGIAAMLVNLCDILYQLVHDDLPMG